MVRRTKEQAAETRNAILDAAERLFVEQGVARTALQDIASAAGVTRGAVYWYFDDKSRLINAITERGAQPLEIELDWLDQRESRDPLGDLCEFAITVLRYATRSVQARHVFEILLLKTESTADMKAILWHRTQALSKWRARAERRIALAKQYGVVSDAVDGRIVALSMWMMVEGLLRTWLLDAAGFDLVQHGRRMIATYLAGLPKRSRTHVEACARPI
jgi:TetR/AcrR family acrAB operon transcriptional repressor